MATDIPGKNGIIISILSLKDIMDFSSQIIDWKNPHSWCPVLSCWIQPYLNTDGIKSLQKMGHQDICWDDLAWLEKLQLVTKIDTEALIQQLSDDLKIANVKVYHGCRPAMEPM